MLSTTRLAALAAFAASTAAQTCYNPDRTTSSNSVPCTSSNETFCCGSNAICISSGYCLSVTAQPYTLYRGSCTDSGWGDFCAYYCVNYRTATNAPIVSVGTNDDGRAIYCCGGQSSNSSSSCENGDDPFVLEDGEMIFGVAALADATSDSNANSTASDSGSDSNSGGADGGQDGSGSSSESNCSNNDVAIGAGVGVPLGVLALSAVAWALLERRKRLKPAGTGDVYASGAGDTGIPVQTQQVYVPPPQKGHPTELDAVGKARISEIMGSEGDNWLSGI
ncbi:hypothetical protein BDW74DRAFT_153981 [Aspergillus multicolor]|uniref:uncharacterized protein n=1 Tax=Aspergillus multicolor TaxID=41759 RepID=UPI003CCE143A